MALSTKRRMDRPHQQTKEEKTIELMVSSRSVADSLLARLVSTGPGHYYDVERDWRGGYGQALNPPLPPKRVDLTQLGQLEAVALSIRSASDIEELRRLIRNNILISTLSKSAVNFIIPSTGKKVFDCPKDQPARVLIPMNLLLPMKAYTITLPDEESVVADLGSGAKFVAVCGIDGPLACEIVDEDYVSDDELMLDKDELKRLKSHRGENAKDERRTEKIGRYERCRLLRRFGQFIADSDLLLSQDDVQSCANRALQFAVAWDAKTCQEHACTALRQLLCGYNLSQKRDILLISQKKNTHVIRCHVGVRHWGQECYGLGIALESRVM